MIKQCRQFFERLQKHSKKCVPKRTKQTRFCAKRKQEAVQLELVASLTHRSVDSRVFLVVLRRNKNQIMSKK